MAKRKRKSKKMKPAEQPQAAQKAWRSIFRIVAGVVIIGVVAGAFWHLRSRQPMVSQSQLPPAVTHPSETQPQTPLPQTKIKHSKRGYLEWETQETDLGNGKKRVEGHVRWNEKSGANGEPVIGMPLIVAIADHKKKELTEIANGVTDSNGRFRLIIPTTTGDIRLGCDFHKARNIPQKVILEQGRKNRSAEEDRLLQKVMDVERRVNSETTWGNKVNRWIDNQQTAVYVDYSSSTAAWGDLSRRAQDGGAGFCDREVSDS